MKRENQEIRESIARLLENDIKRQTQYAGVDKVKGSNLLGKNSDYTGSALIGGCCPTCGCKCEGGVLMAGRLPGTDIVKARCNVKPSKKALKKMEQEGGVIMGGAEPTLDRKQISLTHCKAIRKRKPSEWNLLVKQAHTELRDDPEYQNATGREKLIMGVELAKIMKQNQA